MTGTHTLSDLARYVGVSKRTAQRWKAERLIPPPVVMGSPNLWTRDQVHEVLQWHLSRLQVERRRKLRIINQRRTHES